VPEGGPWGGATDADLGSSAAPASPQHDDELEPEMRARLRASHATRTLAEGTLTRLHGGFSNHAWRVDVPGGPWYARLNAADGQSLGVDRASECALLTATGSAGLAPELLACEPANRLLVTRYVVARPWRPEEAASTPNLERIAGMLRRLHELPVPAGVARMDWPGQARHLAMGLAEAPGDAEIHRIAGEVFAQLEARQFVPSLCHNDLHHLNILDDGARLWLVDWEYGGLGDPLFDLAGFVSMNGLEPCLVETFVCAYGRLKRADLDRFEAACWAFDYVQWLWYRLRSGAAAGEAAARAQRLAQRLLHCDNRSDTQADG
jgi:thiamine kinase-like enzyme